MTHELRKDPLLGRWVVVYRNSKGPEDYPVLPTRPEDEHCFLCDVGVEGGPEIASTIVVPESTYWKVNAIRSRDPVLEPMDDLGRRGVGMYDKMNSAGIHEIIVESPSHKEHPEDHGEDQMLAVLQMQKERFLEIGRDEKVRYILISKNTGLLAGSVNSHPHSQILATPVIPLRIKTELDGSRQYYEYKERCIFCDFIDEEARTEERTIERTKHFLAFCPYASKFPFEFWVMPLRHHCAFTDMVEDEAIDLSALLARLFKKLRVVLNEPAYSYVIHTAPNRIPRRNLWHTLGEDYHWHMEVAPRLLRASGFEWGSGLYTNTTAPEDAARYLREA
jgi:UDPglucose--hexose-1-phosphate uridylyltransferase